MICVFRGIGMKLAWSRSCWRRPWRESWFWSHPLWSARRIVFPPEGSRRERVRALIGLAKEHVGREGAILQRARTLNNAGLGGRDALHLAAAEQARVDCFVTCDDKLLKRARRLGSPMKVASPMELLEEGWI